MLPSDKYFDPDEEILLPQTEEQFDLLVRQIMDRFRLENFDHTAAVLAAQIQRIPPDQAYSTLKFLGHSVLKSISYAVALHKSRKLSHKNQIDVIAEVLKNNPYDQQALDALETASKDGSEYAREILSLYRPVDAGDNVLQMNPLAIPPDENKGPAV